MSSWLCPSLLDLLNEEGCRMGRTGTDHLLMSWSSTTEDMLSAWVCFVVWVMYQSYAPHSWKRLQSAVYGQSLPILPSWALFLWQPPLLASCHPHCLPRCSAETHADGIWFPRSTRASQLQMGTVTSIFKGAWAQHTEHTEATTSGSQHSASTPAASHRSEMQWFARVEEPYVIGISSPLRGPNFYPSKSSLPTSYRL